MQFDVVCFQVDDWSLCPLQQMYVIITMFAAAVMHRSNFARICIPSLSDTQGILYKALVSRLISSGADVFNHNATRIRHNRQ